MAFSGRVVYVSDVPAASEHQPFEGVPEVLDKRGVADLLGVTPRTVDREIARGRLRCARIGRCVRVTKQQLLNYLEECSND